MLKRTRIALLVVLLAVLALPAQAQQAVRIREITAAIAEGPDRAARRAAITRYLDAAHIEYQLQETGEPGRSLTNVVATIQGQTSKTILLGAHYDRVPQGIGVLDNGTSCAVLLHLLELLKARPASLTVRVVFFDLEEVGLLGSKAYFARTESEPKPSYAANLDIFSYGDAFFLTASDLSGPLATKFQKAAADSGIGVRTSPPAQYPDSDHESMIAAGIETLGIALIDKAEVDSVLAFVGGGAPQGPPPRVLTIIHTARDTMEVFKPDDVEKGAAAIERFVRNLD